MPEVVFQLYYDVFVVSVFFLLSADIFEVVIEKNKILLVDWQVLRILKVISGILLISIGSILEVCIDEGSLLSSFYGNIIIVTSAGTIEATLIYIAVLSMSHSIIIFV